MRNVSSGVVKFKYKLPNTSFFFLNFPDLITLCPGMAETVDVSFRPIRAEPYDDVIEFNSSNGTFYVRVRATLAEFGVKMQVPNPLAPHISNRDRAAETGCVGCCAHPARPSRSARSCPSRRSS